MKSTVLIIRNGIHEAQRLQVFLEKQGALVDVSYDGEHGINYAQNNMYDAIVTDSFFSQTNGVEVIKELHKINSSTPLLVLTSKAEIIGLKNELDDEHINYICKPFTANELLDKLKSLLGEQKQEDITKSVCFGDVELNLANETLVCNGNREILNNKEFQIIGMFMYSPEQIFSKQQIFDRVWGDIFLLDYNNIEVYVSLLRKKLKSIGSNVQIRTARGVGYALTMRR